MTATAVAAQAPVTKKRDRPRIAIGVCILAGVVIVYVLSLFGVHFLQRSEGPLPPLDLSQGGGDATIVQLRLEELKPVANRLSVNVLVYPGVAQYDNRFDVLANDVAVRLYPTSDLGDLHYPKGKALAQLSTTVEAHGDPGNWPFDSYRTEPISADAFVGSGDNLKKVPARVEVTGALDGWQITVDRVRDPAALPTQRGSDNGDVVITLKRAKGPLIFDLGICLVLISLPTLALLVAIPMAMGRRKFLAPFATWYAANLFAIVPLRNILPGAPPPGSWIDQAIVQWVLIALVAAMTLYIIAWVRQGD
ncbi:membrane protein [Mycobacterium avium subsp. avium 11-4751]|nr:membrane protein [Mycobacterium avium subsp. avium 11-4751]